MKRRIAKPVNNRQNKTFCPVAPLWTISPTSRSARPAIKTIRTIFKTFMEILLLI
jgi:hypothetical protein